MNNLAKELHEVVALTWKAFRTALDNSDSVENLITNILAETDPLDEKFRSNETQMEFYKGYIRLLTDSALNAWVQDK